MAALDFHFFDEQVLRQFSHEVVFVYQIPVRIFVDFLRWPNVVKLCFPAVCIVVKFNNAAIIRDAVVRYQAHWNQKAEMVANVVAAAYFVVFQEFFAGVGIHKGFFKIIFKIAFGKFDFNFVAEAMPVDDEHVRLPVGMEVVGEHNFVGKIVVGMDVMVDEFLNLQHSTKLRNQKAAAADVGMIDSSGNAKSRMDAARIGDSF